MATREMLTAQLPIDASLATYMQVFRTLPPLLKEEFHGTFQGIVVGPAWFQKVFNRLMVVGGLGGWQGKEFGADGNGVNVVQRGGKISHVAPMLVLGTFPSAFDGQPTLVLGYHNGLHIHINDEIRRLDERTVLGMTYLKYGFLKQLPMPFVLRWK